MVEAVILILEKGGKKLFALRNVERESLPGRWSLPSGKIQPGETALAAAKREAMEELGIEIENPKEVDSIVVTHNSQKRGLHFIEADYQQEPTIMAPNEIVELQTHTFANFFSMFGDGEIGTALQYLRKQFNNNH